MLVCNWEQLWFIPACTNQLIMGYHETKMIMTAGGKAALIQHGTTGCIQQGTTAVCLAGTQPLVSTLHLTELTTLIQ